MQKRWTYKTKPAPEAVERLAQAININPYLSTLLIQRGVTTFQEAKQFFRPELVHLHDPFAMRDMTAAVERIQQAITHEEKILVFGDYDVDGTTAVALVYSYLRQFYPHCSYYIPDRYSEGYGVSETGIRWAEQNDFKLIIALDLGIKSSDMVMLAQHKGIDFIICDHHLPGGEIPQAVAVLDPKRADCAYPFQELSGCGIGFKLMQAYARTYRREEEVFAYLDLVAVSIASDIVPINGENRVLAFAGLEKLNRDPVPGLQALKHIAGIQADADIGTVVFSLGPRINAAGRLAHAHGAVELLISKTEAEALLLAEKLNLTNVERREVDTTITEEAVALIESDPFLQNARSTVLYKETWHKGVIGIVAARCVEKYYRPTVILTQSNGKITGSARSVKGFDLYEALVACSPLLDKYGGHKYAAGLTMSPENYPAFRQRFEEVVSERISEEMLIPSVDIDLVIPFDAITPRFIQLMKQFAPFGPENLKPVFESRNVFVQNALTNLKDKHVRFLAGQHGNSHIFTAIGFDMLAYYPQLQEGAPFRMAYTVEENTFNGETSVQLRIKDLKFN
jgi:single-stranded-DNA-specific exonuclease